jgi:tetratricopeptide (TPR) repeat protein
MAPMRALQAALARHGCVWLMLGIALGLWVAHAEQPVGLVLEDGTGSVHRPGRETLIDARAGVELFAGDKLVAGETGIVFAFCPANSAQTLPAHREIVVDASTLPGIVTGIKPLSICELPAMSRLWTTAITPRPQVSAEGSFEDRIQKLSEPGRSAFRKQWATTEQASGEWELLTAVSRASILEDAGLRADAITECDRIAARWPAATWTAEVAMRMARGLAGTRGVRVNRPDAAPAVLKGKTYALLLGISRYKSVPQLNYADKDAESFAAYLQMPRGGSLRLCSETQTTDCEIRLIENEQATLARVSSEFESFVSRDDHAQAENTFILFIAAHGADPSMEADWAGRPNIGRNPVILTWDSDYNEAKVSGYVMSELRDLLARQALRYGRVLVFVDVCRAGNIGPISGTSEEQPAVREVFQGKGNLGLFMASQAGEDAFESDKFGGGHGAFSYYVLEGLNRVEPDRQQIVFFDLKRRIEDGVSTVTLGKQIPQSRAVDERMPVAEHLNEPPMSLRPAIPIDKKTVRRPRGVRAAAPRSVAGGTTAPSTDEFERALALGHLRRDEPDSAFAVLDRRRSDPSAVAAQIAAEGEQLRIALEDRGQQVILQYLRGEQSPPTREDFARAQKDFAAALELAPAAPFNESRMLFCRGRALIFEKQYDAALAALKAATRIDPVRSYAYNAIGIAYLEQASRDSSYLALAEEAFHDAIRYAPYWPYPWHNLALVATERGDFQSAISHYRHAMEIAPDYPYLPYNLALLCQRLNRIPEAQHYYQQALVTAARGRANGILAHPDGRQPEDALVHNALGTLAAARKSSSAAEREYREAIREDGSDLSARYNLAVLLSSGERTSAESENLWKQILAEEPHHLTSRLAYARYLAAVARWADAVAQYRLALQDAQELTPVRRELASALLAEHNPQAAKQVLQDALAIAPNDPVLWEGLGDAEASLGNYMRAEEDYRRAEGSADQMALKRLKAKRHAQRGKDIPASN